MATAAKKDPASLAEAVLAVQAELPTLPKDARNPHFKSKYTPLDTIVERVGPIMAKYGLVWQTFPTLTEAGAPALRYKLTHAPSGDFDQDVMPLLLQKNDAQGLGSAVTYARRYSLCAVLNIVADEDDDGEATRQAALNKSEKKSEPKAEKKADPPAEKKESKPEDDEPTGEKGAILIIEKHAQSNKTLEDIKAWLVAAKVEDVDSINEDMTLDDLGAYLAALPKRVTRGMFVWLKNSVAKAEREAKEKAEAAASEGGE